MDKFKGEGGKPSPIFNYINGDQIMSTCCGIVINTLLKPVFNIPEAQRRVLKQSGVSPDRVRDLTFGSPFLISNNDKETCGQEHLLGAGPA
jgi:hypothetical protein